MNKPLMLLKIRDALERRGIAPDLVDLHAEIDSELSYSENLSAILETHAALCMGDPSPEPAPSIQDGYCLMQVLAMHHVSTNPGETAEGMIRDFNAQSKTRIAVAANRDEDFSDEHEECWLIATVPKVTR